MERFLGDSIEKEIGSALPALLLAFGYRQSHRKSHTVHDIYIYIYIYMYIIIYIYIHILVLYYILVRVSCIVCVCAYCEQIDPCPGYRFN